MDEKQKCQVAILLGKNIKEKRKCLGISQEELGKISGLHRTYIGHIERAEKNLTLKNIGKIAESLHVDPVELFDFSNLK